MAVRNPDGEIVLEVSNNSTKTPAIAKIPVVRGVYNFAMSMIQGYKCLMRSAEISGLEEAEEEMRREKEAKKAAKAAKKAAKKGETLETTEPVGANQDSPANDANVGANQDSPANDANVGANQDSPETTDPVGANQDSPAEEPAPAAPAKKEKKTDSASLTTTLVMILGVVLGLGLAILLFKFVPTALYDLIVGLVPVLKPEDVALDSFIRSLIEGILKIVIVVGYMAAVSLMKEIRRTFRYHGAEHKTIFCYEAGLPLTVENVRKQKRFHPRCGTSFLILMVRVNVFVSFFINPVFMAIAGFPMEELAEVFRLLPTLVRTGISLVLLPLVMGIGYELLKLAGRYDTILTRLISLPGVWLQHITVLEPDDSMIECAIAAVKEVIPEDESDRW
ncbi:MAG: DUF1385 domain-containing protein [Clostridia bacterium]|nr:DUF1385 domain-containing protein [Clostridia bacterium]